MELKCLVAGILSVMMSASLAKAQCQVESFNDAIEVSENGTLNIVSPQTNYSYSKKSDTIHQFVPKVSLRVQSAIGRPLLRKVVTDSQKRVQSIEFNQWGHDFSPTPEQVFTAAYKDDKCYIEKWNHKDGKLFAHTGMCHDLRIAGEACKLDCEGKTHDEKLKEIITRYGGSLENRGKVQKKFKMDITLQTERSGLYQSAIYLERCEKFEPIRAAIQDASLWSTGSTEAARKKASQGRH